MPLLSEDIIQIINPDMLKVHDKACQLIELSSPQNNNQNKNISSSSSSSSSKGRQLLVIVKQLLNREKRFIWWKHVNCPSYEVSCEEYSLLGMNLYFMFFVVHDDDDGKVECTDGVDDGVDNDNNENNYADVDVLDVVLSHLIYYLS